jgi:DNA primase catalytic core
MFPWIAVNGKVVAFGGRVLDARTKGVNQKYVNSPDSLIYHKANELYGIFQAKKQIAKEDMVYMVEGYTDVLAMHQCGIENVVANSGTALNEAQIHLLHRFTNNITLLYDSDEAGIHAATRSTDMLLAEGMNVKTNTPQIRQYRKNLLELVLRLASALDQIQALDAETRAAVQAARERVASIIGAGEAPDFEEGSS